MAQETCEACHGSGEIPTAMGRPINCPICGGTDPDAIASCPYCDIYGNINQPIVCPQCGGDGIVGEARNAEFHESYATPEFEVCGDCGGSKIMHNGFGQQMACAGCGGAGQVMKGRI